MTSVDEAETATAEAVACEQEPIRSRAATITWLAGTAVLSLAAVAAVVVAVLLVRHRLAEQEVADRHDAVVQAATDEITNLITLNYNDPGRNLRRLTDGATGELAEELGGKQDALTGFLTQGQIRSEGTVTAAAVAADGPDTAQVLLAVQAKIYNSEAPAGTVHDYRVRVTMNLVGGRWLTSKAEAVS